MLGPERVQKTLHRFSIIHNLIQRYRNNSNKTHVELIFIAKAVSVNVLFRGGRNYKSNFISRLI